MSDGWMTLVEINSDTSRLRLTTSAEADPMVLAVGYLLDQYLSETDREHVIAHMEVQNRSSSVTVKYADWVVEARAAQHWDTLDFPEHHELAARLRERYPQPVQYVHR